MTAYIHPSADVQTTQVGDNTRIWQFVVILLGARIGADVNVCSHCFIENDVVVGDRVTIKSGVQLWDGLRVGDDVFIGPNVSFTNDRFPRSRQYQDQVSRTEVEAGASVGAGAVILPGLKIGRGAMVGAGAVVTRSVPPNAVVVGNPARVVGYTDAEKSAVPIEARAVTNAAALLRESVVRGVRLFDMPRFSDPRGSLTVGEFAQAIPFEVKRYFIVFDVPSSEVRGEHAHRECHQFLVCAHGSVAVVADDGKRREEILLDGPERGLYLPPMTWGIQYKYSADAVLLVFASHPYDAKDYIRSYDEFLSLTGSRP
jgi:acetyltransferase-like isoleucine patch superfamily enzyme/dTDP-4-dehydrorhamnose 3,5-epimerase-like enzyme